MSKDPSILRRNKVNWHYVRDDHMFSTIKLVSRHQNTQQFGALLPIELTNEDIKNSTAYKEYYALATVVTPPKPKASVQKTRSSSDRTITPPTVAVGPRLTTSEKGKQAAKASIAKSLSGLSEVAMTKAQQLKLATKRSLQQIHISQASGSGADEGTEDDDDEGKDGDGDDEGNDEFVHPSLSTHAEEETRDEETFDPILKTPENTDDEGNGEENLGTNVGRDEGHDEEEDEDELYRDININQGRDTYRDTIMLKRRRDDDADKDEEPSAGSDRGSKRRREGKEPESASTPKEKATRSAGKSTQRSKSQKMSASESATTEEPMQTTFEMEEPAHP
nr:hypothetical protein [Tanacetum cinerariifolium]